MRKLRAHYQWLQIAFAVAWIGVLSLYWIRIKMGATFQSLLAAGLAQPFPPSVVYVTFIYVFAITAILWAGLCIYLAITASLNLRRLLRGLCPIAIVVVPSLSSGIPQRTTAFASGCIPDLVVAVACGCRYERSGTSRGNCSRNIAISLIDLQSEQRRNVANRALASILTSQVVRVGAP